MNDSVSLVLDDSAYMRVIDELDVTQLYVDGLNDPEVNQFLNAPRSQMQTIASVEAFVRMNRESDSSLLFGLYVHDILRGTLRLHDAVEGNVFLGLALFDKRIWGQGWGRKMINAATHYALETMQVRKVSAGIDVGNISSQKAFSAVGYERNRLLDKSSDHGVVQIWELVR